MGPEVEVTEADREKAREFAADIETAPTPEYRDDVERDIARALADERAKTRAPFLALAEELDGQADEILARSPLAPYDHGRGLARESIARMIRRAAEDPPEVRET